MTISIRTISVSTAGFWLAATAASWAVAGPLFAAGVALTGGLMVFNLQLWVWVCRRLIAATVAGEGAGLSGAAIALKLLIVLTALFGLLAIFPPASVLIGSSVAVAGIVSQAALALHPRFGEG